MQRKINIKPEDMKELKKRKKKEDNAKIYKRLLALEMRGMGVKCKDIADIIGVCIDTVSDWINLFLAGGIESLCYLSYDGRRRSKLEDYKEAMKVYVEENRVSTLLQIKSWLKDIHNMDVEESWLSRFCKKNFIYPIKKPD